MLVKVSVENFKSFDKAAELTMISSNKIRTNANHRLKIKSTQLLKYAVASIGIPLQTLSLKNLKNNARLVFPDAFAP